MAEVTLAVCALVAFFVNFLLEKQTARANGSTSRAVPDSSATSTVSICAASVKDMNGKAYAAHS